MKNTCFIITMFLTVIINGCTNESWRDIELSKDDSLQIKISFIDNINHPGQSILINQNKNYKLESNNNSGEFIEIAMPDSTYLFEIYHLIKLHNDTLYDEESKSENWKYFLKISISNKDVSEEYTINNKIKGYDLFRNIYCISNKDTISNKETVQRNTGTIRNILRFINSSFNKGKENLPEAFGLDTFCVQLYDPKS